MKSLAWLVMLFAVSSTCLFAAEKMSNAEIVQLLITPKALVQVNAKRVEISPEVKLLCAPPNEEDIKTHRQLVAGKSAFVNVFVTPGGVDAMKDRPAVFPVGTVILKQKFPTATSKTTELYTGMLKREPGYNPDCGDWEFFTLSGNGKVVTARGKIDSCIECHKEYPKTDFVTKEYR